MNIRFITWQEENIIVGVQTNGMTKTQLGIVLKLKTIWPYQLAQTHETEKAG
jgi:hypothetical protein